MDIGLEEIRSWHVGDNGWSDIGYHFVIRKSGEVEAGRDIVRTGAHTLGHNTNSIGICLVGGNNEADFTFKQYKALDKLVNSLQRNRQPLRISGHNEYSSKECPCFNVKEFFK
jgi:N-acetyl-anhydromuramyl-L-alanine amidase AmpD